ncbi:O-antigen ligase family protein [Noviherbaspirillum aridicola]|uniref:O-antigen ligase family protein n=1 Tax=Noviherbaspirillum aridicola TaxID=2849687 RepID=UPI001C7E2C57|nr:O-antigen ligase family protein [Noviherbaspirillum aridicola]
MNNLHYQPAMPGYNRRRAEWRVTAMCIAASVVLGAATVILPWWFVFALLLLPILAFVAWNYPEIAVVGIMAMLFGAVPEALMPRLPIAGGGVNLEDLGIVGMLLLLLIRRSGRVRELIAPVGGHLPALVAFLGVAVVSAVIAIFYKTAAPKDVLNEARPYFTWLLLPVLCLAVDNDVRARRFKKWLFALAVVLAAGMVLQSLTGVALFGKGRVWSSIGVSGEVLRSTTPGMFLMAGGLIYLLAAYAHGRHRFGVWMMVFGGLAAGGTLVGFGRGLWIAVIAGVGLLALQTRGERYIRLLMVLSVGALVLGGLVAVAKPEYLIAASDRLLSVGDEVEHGASYGRRKVENAYAMAKIAQHPVLGVGLGGAYKPPEAEYANFIADTRYIHNSYVNITTKLGLPGLAALLWLVVSVLRRTWSAARDRAGDRALGFAAFWIAFATMVVTAMTQPNMAAANGVGSIALAIFLAEYARRDRTTGGASGVPVEVRHG